MTPREVMLVIDTVEEREANRFDDLGQMLARFTAVIANSSGNYKKGKAPTSEGLWPSRQAREKKNISLDQVREQQKHAQQLVDRLPTPRQTRKHLTQ